MGRSAPLRRRGSPGISLEEILPLPGAAARSIFMHRCLPNPWNRHDEKSVGPRALVMPRRDRCGALPAPFVPARVLRAITMSHLAAPPTTSVGSINGDQSAGEVPVHHQLPTMQRNALSRIFDRPDFTPGEVAGLGRQRLARAEGIGLKGWQRSPSGCDSTATNLPLTRAALDRATRPRQCWGPGRSIRRCGSCRAMATRSSAARSARVTGVRPNGRRHGLRVPLNKLISKDSFAAARGLRTMRAPSTATELR